MLRAWDAKPRVPGRVSMAAPLYAAKTADARGETKCGGSSWPSIHVNAARATPTGQDVSALAMGRRCLVRDVAMVVLVVLVVLVAVAHRCGGYTTGERR